MPTRATWNLPASRLTSASCPIRFFHANFSELPAVLATVGVTAVDAILADLGISTNQLFDGAVWDVVLAAHAAGYADRPANAAQSPADLVNTLREEDLANVLYELAQERYSRRIARKIGPKRGKIRRLIRQIG